MRQKEKKKRLKSKCATILTEKKVADVGQFQAPRSQKATRTGNILHHRHTLLRYIPAVQDKSGCYQVRHNPREICLAFGR